MSVCAWLKVEGSVKEGKGGYPEDGVNILLRTLGTFRIGYTASHAGRRVRIV